jgi:hypothetical protein
LTFEVFKAFPPDRETAVAELNFRHDGFVDVPAEVFWENGEMRITIFGREGGAAWEYSLREWTEAVQRAMQALGGEISDGLPSQ